MTSAIALAAAILLQGCGGGAAQGPPRDPELMVDASSARTAFDDGLYDEAAADYRKALQRAWAIDRPLAIADVSYNLAICEIALGQIADARGLLEDAQIAAARADRPASDIMLARAKAAWLAHDESMASDLAAQTAADPKAPAAVVAQARLLQGQIALAHGDLAGAQSALNALAALKLKEPSIVGGAASLSGHIALMQHDPAGAVTQFDAAAAAQQSAHRYAAMRQALADAGNADAASEKWTEAADRLFRAARSAAGDGDLAGAQKLAAAAKIAAAHAGQPAVAAEVDRLEAAMAVAAAAQPASTEAATPDTIAPATTEDLAARVPTDVPTTAPIAPVPITPVPITPVPVAPATGPSTGP